MTRPQHMDALAKGNRIRLDRAQLKRDIKAGRVNVADVIAYPPECVATMHVVELLACQRWWGWARAARMMERADLSMSKTFDGMLARQTARLLRELA